MPKTGPRPFGPGLGFLTALRVSSRFFSDAHARRGIRSMPGQNAGCGRHLVPCGCSFMPCGMSVWRKDGGVTILLRQHRARSARKSSNTLQRMRRRYVSCNISAKPAQLQWPISIQVKLAPAKGTWPGAAGRDRITDNPTAKDYISPFFRSMCGAAGIIHPSH